MHLHRCFDPTSFLDHARSNLVVAAGQGLGSSVGCLWITDPAGESSFDRLGALLEGRGPAGWSLSRTGEPGSILARHESGDTLVVLAGRQIQTRERLEVLALGGVPDTPSWHGLGDTIAAIRRSGGIAVIPWGFGKWWLGRGRMLASTLASVPADGVFVGDNAGRTWAAPRSRLFELAASRGIYNLPGSDPLPLRWEIRKPGRAGCVLEGPLDLSRPAGHLVRKLSGLRTQPPVFRRPESLPGFARSQLALRLGGAA